MTCMPEDFKRLLTEVLAAHPPQHVQIDDARAAAVLVPVVANPEPSLILTVRTDTLPSHKGQISFPGGSIDDDDPSPEFAALRETEEEIGLDPNAVEVIGELDTMPTFVSGYVISPFVGWLNERPTLQPNPAEVAEVLIVPIASLTDSIRAEPGFSHAGRTYPTEAWVWEERVIWGVTARLLRDFLRLVSETGFVDAPGPTSSWTAWPLDATARP